MLAALVFGYWQLPISGQIVVVPGDWRNTNAWPQVRLDPENARPGQRAIALVSDTIPWAYVKLAVAGSEATLEDYEANSGYGTWRWSFIVPDSAGYEFVFYHDCDTGCIERARVTIGALESRNLTQPAQRIPTKLGIVFAHPERDWHHRAGWDVELTYVMKAESEYWGIDDLAGRVQGATAKGLRVLVRVDYDQGQSIPPANDYLALDAYLDYVRRLARDARLNDVYGYIIGSGYNTKGSNSQAVADLVTPEWYARVFNGYEAEPEHGDNTVEAIHAENPAVQVLVGPVRPWVDDQNGQRRYRLDQPWLNYMNTLVASLDASATANAAIGIPFVGPDGFAVQAPGRPDAPEFATDEGATEPHRDLRRNTWGQAQAGFRVYGDWLDIINAYPYTKGLPVYITSTNTYQPDTDVKPAQNYPRGWLSAALEVINNEPQVRALCWFLDSFPLDKQWELFSLTNPKGLLVDAADEFDSLLKSQP
ncbi:MAG: hypothetical protein HYZ49_11185 [Chloroflexi bacterium]|nr:hypothetical protein [Chloroflexota bacterium]